MRAIEIIKVERERPGRETVNKRGPARRYRNRSIVTESVSQLPTTFFFCQRGSST